MAKDTSALSSAGHPDQSEISVVAARLGSLLARIRDSLRKTQDAFRSEAFHGSLDEVLSIRPADINTTASYLLKIGMTREEGQRFCDEWERCREEYGLLQALMYLQPGPADHQAIADDPDPWIARYNQAVAKRVAEWRESDLRGIDRQRSIAVDAVSILSAHVDDLIGTVKATLHPEAATAITVDEANTVAMKLAKQDPAFVKGGVRKWAEAIREAAGKTCSISTVKKTPLWKETMKTTGRGKTRGKTPKAVSLTDNMEAVIGDADRNETLKNLMAEQEADYEASPLEDDPPATRRKTKCYKRV